MENELFINSSEINSSSAMLNWASMEIQPIESNLSLNPSRDCFFWEKSTEQSIFDSALSSLVSSPTPSNSNFSGGGGEKFVIRELIGKLGNIGNCSNEIYGSNGNGNGNGKGNGYSVTKTAPLTEFSGDPGFAERAARFSCFGSRSFNGRTNTPISAPVVNIPTNGKLTRVSSSPALKNQGDVSVSVSVTVPTSKPMIPGGEFSRKRKGKSKDNSASPSPNLSKEIEEKDESDRKKSKGSDENGEKSKAPEPYKDFIHVRARRGQATDSHSLAERVRREKIGERMKLLQDLVPGCNKVTGKALMLDEIINYVQSLQRQVEFLSMKLSSVNTRLDYNVDTLVSKDILTLRNNPMHQQILQLESSAETLLGAHNNMNLQISPNISSNNIMVQCPMDPLESSQLPSLTHYTDSIPQYSTFSENDLHSIIQMGYAQNQSDQVQVQQNNFRGSSNQVQSHMKTEL